MDKLDELSLVGVNLAELTRATKELRQTRDEMGNRLDSY